MVVRRVTEKKTKGNVEETGTTTFDLKEHFRYLVDTPGFEPVFEAVFARATKMSGDARSLTVHFGPKMRLHATPPAAASAYKKWPRSFQAAIANHEHLSFPDQGGVHLGEAGTFESRYLDDSKLSRYERSILVPVTDYSDWWLYDPEEKNAHGELGLSYFSHEGGDVGAPVDLNVGALFLRRMAEILELGIELPSGAAPAPKGTGARKLTPLPIAPALSVSEPVFCDARGERLFTFDDGAMTLWNIVDAAFPMRLGRVALPRAMRKPHGNFQAQFVSEDDVLVFDRQGWVRFDVSDPKAPSVTSHFDADWGRAASWLVDDQIITYHYLHDRDGLTARDAPAERKNIVVGNGFAIQPVSGGGASIRHFHPSARRYPQSSLTVGARLFMLGQTNLHEFDVTDPAAPRLVSELSWDGAFFEMLALPERKLLVVLEHSDENKYGLCTINITKKPKHGVRLLKNHTVRARHLDGDDLWLTLHDTKRKRHLAHVRFGPSAPEVVSQIELPFDDEVFVSWMHVRDGKAVFVLQSGELKAFQLGSAHG